MTQDYDFSDISSMSHSEIKAKIAEIDHLQAEFSKRDFDAELGQAMVSGKNLDELESQHLEAERLSRRLRVARASLENRLPVADMEEAEARLSALAERHADLFRERAELAQEIASQVDRIEGLTGNFRAKTSEMMTVANQMASEGAGLEKRTGHQSPLPAIDRPRHDCLKPNRLQAVWQQLGQSIAHSYPFGEHSLVYKTEGGDDAAAAA